MRPLRAGPARPLDAAAAARELAKAVGLGGAATAARVASRTASGRAEKVEVQAGERRVGLAATDCAQRLGFSKLPSLAFDVRAEDGDFVFEGRGQGHGAGLCQWGAAGLAREGKTYRRDPRPLLSGTNREDA